MQLVEIWQVVTIDKLAAFIGGFFTSIQNIKSQSPAKRFVLRRIER